MPTIDPRVDAYIQKAAPFAQPILAHIRMVVHQACPDKAFAPGQRRDYVDWITEAKQEATRANRLATAVGWIAEGELRNWKYIK